MSHTLALTGRRGGLFPLCVFSSYSTGRGSPTIERVALHRRRLDRFLRLLFRHRSYGDRQLGQLASALRRRRLAAAWKRRAAVCVRRQRRKVPLSRGDRSSGSDPCRRRLRVRIGRVDVTGFVDVVALRHSLTNVRKKTTLNAFTPSCICNATAVAIHSAVASRPV